MRPCGVWAPTITPGRRLSSSVRWPSGYRTGASSSADFTNATGLNVKYINVDDKIVNVEGIVQQYLVELEVVLK